MPRRFIAILFLAFTLAAAAKDEIRYPVSAIPENLKTGANSVVRLSTVTADVISDKEVVTKTVEAVTLLNDKAKGSASFSCTVSGFSELKEFEGSIYSANGQMIKKIKKGDLESTEYSGSSTLSDDIKTWFYEPQASTYPVTIEYKYTIRETDLVNSYETFYGLDQYEQSIQEKSYSIACPPGKETICIGGDSSWGPETSTRKDGKTVKTWKANNLVAIKKESNMPPADEIFPILYVLPEQFTYKGTVVSNTSWQDYGRWIQSLTEGRDVLPEALKSKVHELTDGLSSDLEKVKALYDYMGSTCRYVSIQLGIGGLQPRSVSDTYAAKFGDCKALSFYLKSMLAECGISSNLCIISTRRKKLDKDHPNTLGINHEILKVNLPGSPLWIECTNSRLPMGYIHSDISGHDAIVISDADSHLETLPEWTFSQNIDSYSNSVKISADGNAEITFSRTAEGLPFENLYGFKFITADNQKERVKDMSNLSGAKVMEVNGTFSEGIEPRATISGTMTASGFASVSQNRITFPAQTFRSRQSKFKTQRTFDIYIGSSYTQPDTIVYTLPESYAPEVLPSPVSIHAPFGDFEGECTYDSETHTITVSHTLTIKAGTHDPSKAPAFADFLTAINQFRTANIVLKRQ